MPEDSLDIGRRIQEKFEFYFLSLTFVVLGLSIQTSRFDGHLLADGFELISWMCLFVSGLSGLFRMRQAGPTYRVAHGTTTAKTEKEMEAYKTALATLQKKNIFRHKLHVWGFAVGLFFLICSRGLEPASRLVEWIIKGDTTPDVW